MGKLFKRILGKWLTYKNKRIKETEARIKKHEELEKLKRRFQEKKEELDRLKSFGSE